MSRSDLRASADWLFAANPIVGQPLTAPALGDGPNFQPAVLALHQWKPVSVGLEYYGNLGAFSAGFLPVQKQEHYLYDVVNLHTIRRFELNLGFGHGLTEASNAFLAKLIVGYRWERE